MEAFPARRALDAVVVLNAATRSTTDLLSHKLGASALEVGLRTHGLVFLTDGLLGRFICVDAAGPHNLRSLREAFLDALWIHRGQKL